jgi:hypothetical protein
VAGEHFLTIDSAYVLVGRYQEAIAPLKQALTRYPNIMKNEKLRIGKRERLRLKGEERKN